MEHFYVISVFSLNYTISKFEQRYLEQLYLIPHVNYARLQRPKRALDVFHVP